VSRGRGWLRGVILILWGGELLRMLAGSEKVKGARNRHP
jgi:hypothetical protein